MDKLSYALGLSMAQNFKGSGIQGINATTLPRPCVTCIKTERKK